MVDQCLKSEFSETRRVYREYKIYNEGYLFDHSSARFLLFTLQSSAVVNNHDNLHAYSLWAPIDADICGRFKTLTPDLRPY